MLQGRFDPNVPAIHTDVEVTETFTFLRFRRLIHMSHCLPTRWSEGGPIGETREQLGLSLAGTTENFR